jgi:hypothetical protein
MQFQRFFAGKGYGFKVVRHASGTIHDADFLLGAVGSRRVVDDVTDVGKSSGLEQVARDGNQCGLQDEAVSVGVSQQGVGV